MNNQLSNEILERIRANKITPLPRWRFLLLRGMFWFFALLSIIIGSFAVATILFLFVDYNRRDLFAIPYDVAEFLSMIPFLWIIIFALFVVITEISIKHTKQGYRYRLRTIFSTSIILSIIFGSILNFIGIGEFTHEFFNETQFYNYAVYDSKDAWSRPHMGRLAGTVLVVRDDNNFSVVDFNGHIWQVRLATSTSGIIVPEENSIVRMSGILESSSSVFAAYSIYEWER
jgi:hypothetical protein